MQGRIVKLISNQYTVELLDGTIIECLARGKMRLGVSPYAGDIVEVNSSNDKFVIDHIEERKNVLHRPPIANVDQALIVMSACEPDFSSVLVDQLIFLISLADIEPLILITKMDLVKDFRQINEHIEDYRNSGYKVLLSHKDNNEEEIRALSDALDYKITVLCGQSGVGKSSCINKLDDSFNLRTQQISMALNRGKHTTRHVELHKINHGYVADTPGFSKLDFSRVKKEDLASSIKEFIGYHGHCKFNDCLHDHEPFCCVKQAVEEGKISKVRYKHYLECLRIIEEEGKENYE